jgi:hypothetical protein
MNRTEGHNLSWGAMKYSQYYSVNLIISIRLVLTASLCWLSSILLAIQHFLVMLIFAVSFDYFSHENLVGLILFFLW